MGKFFSADNELMKPLTFLADVLILSAMWTLCSIPVITAGAATAAVYDVTARCMRGHDLDMFGRFFRTFKREFLPALVTEILWGLILWGAYSLVKLYGNSVAVSETSTLITVALLFVVTVLVGVFSWILPLLSRFTFSVVGLQITGVRLALSHILRTVALGVITVVAGWICVRRVFPVILLPGLVFLAWSYLMEPVFRTYMPPDIADNTPDTEEED